MIGYLLGKEIGLYSYNDSYIKQVLADEITVIIADYKQLGEEVVKYLLEDSTTTRKII